MAYVVCAVVWGTTWFAIRVCIGPGGYPTFGAAAARFTLAAGLLWVIVKLARLSPGIQDKRQRNWLTAAGILNGLGYALVYVGEETVSGAFAAILFGTIPLVTAILALITKTERVTVGHIAGALISLAGISLIFWERLAVSAQQATGIGLLCAAVVVSAIYSVILKREGRGVHVLVSTSWFLNVTAVVLWVSALAVGQAAIPWPLPQGPTIALLYLAVFGSVLTFACFLYLLQRVSLMTTTTLVFIQPIIALFVDSQWETEVHLSTYSYVGASITMGGVLISVLWNRYRP